MNSHFKVTQSHLLRLLNQFSSPMGKARVHELNEHNIGELADYVAELSATKAPNQDMERWQFYNWMKCDATHYRQWSKRALIQRIMTVEANDALLASGKSIAGTRPSEADRQEEHTAKRTVRKPLDYGKDVGDTPGEVRPVRRPQTASTVQNPAPVEPPPSVE